MPAVLTDALIVLAAFVAVTALAAALGATNFGTALGFGQIAFALAVVAVIAKRD